MIWHETIIHHLTTGQNPCSKFLKKIQIIVSFKENSLLIISLIVNVIEVVWRYIHFSYGKVVGQEA